MWDSLSTDRIRITPPPVVEGLHRVHHLGGSFRDAVARSHLVAVALHYSTAKCVQGIFFEKISAMFPAGRMTDEEGKTARTVLPSLRA